MDVVEMPLSSNVVASKLMAADGFGRIGDPESSGTHRTADSSAFNSGGSSLYQGLRCKENGDAPHIEEMAKPIASSPKHEGKPLNRKSLKKLGVVPGLKRPRTDQIECTIRAADADDLHTQSRHVATEDFEFKLTCPENTGLARKKRCHDSRRVDKKSARVTVRTKHDCFTSKAGFPSSDSAVGGNSILGMSDFKSNLHDLTKLVDEISLNELLDGTYKCPKACPDKGKKAQNGNDGFSLAVRKAYSILPPQGTTDCNGHQSTSLCLQKANSFSASMSDSDYRDTCIEKPASCIKDFFQANLGNSALHQPKIALDRLAIPTGHRLDDLLNLSTISLPSQSLMNMTNSHNASLPPFSWSFSHNGSKPSVDSGKLPSIRSNFQGRWVRIGNSSSSMRNDNKSEQELKTIDNEDRINQQKLEGILQDIKTLTAPGKPSFHKSFSMPQDMSRFPEVCTPDGTMVQKDSQAFASSRCKKLNFMEDLDSSSCKESYRNVESETDLRCQRNDSVLMDPLKVKLYSNANEVAEREQPTGSTYGGCSNAYTYPCEIAIRGSSSWSVPEISEPGHSPRLIMAAKILYEMKTCSRSLGAQNDALGRMKWPKAPSQKTMKARKPTNTAEVTDKLFLEPSHSDLVKSKCPASVKHKSEKKNDFTHTNNVGKEKVSWSASAENSSSPGRMERDYNANSRLSHDKFVRSSGPTNSSDRGEKGYESQQKFNKGTIKTSSLGFGGAYIKDWNRGRSKRM